VPRASLAIGLGAAVAALGLAYWIVTPSTPQLEVTRHPDNVGPLASTDDPWSMGLDPQGETVWSQGIYVCSRDGKDAVLESVTPTGGFGSYRYLGARVREFSPSESHSPLFSTIGFPPDVPDDLLAIEGHDVSAGCSADDRRHTYTEVLLGIARDGGRGGGWTGQEIGYRVGDRRYVLELAFTIAVCGSDVDVDVCPR
jgi:hypothetical protein